MLAPAEEILPGPRARERNHARLSCKRTRVRDRIEAGLCDSP